MASFVHLRVKSAYSLLEGAVRPARWRSLAREAGTPAVAVTDTNNLFGVYEIADTLAKAGIQPIVGALLSVEFAARSPMQIGSRKKPPHLPLLVQNEAGLPQPHQASVGRLSGSGGRRLAACERPTSCSPMPKA